jgi:cytoskeletal protein RodZ
MSGVCETPKIGYKETVMNNLSPQDRHTLDNFRGMTVGQIFKKARIAQGLNIDQIATHLNIGSTHLDAIEADDSTALPPKVYAVGFVRAYADLLQLDAEKMAYLFKVQFYGKKQTDDQKKVVKTDGKKLNVWDVVGQKANLIPMAIVSIVMIVGAICAVIFLLFWVLGADHTQRMVIPEIPQALLEEQSTESVESFIPKTTSNDDKTKPIEPMDLIVKPDDDAQSYGVKPLDAALAFKMMDDVAVEFRAVNNGEVLLAKKFKKGDVFYVGETQDVLVSTPNAGAVSVYLDNQPLGLLGQSNANVRLRPLSVKALRLQR